MKANHPELPKNYKLLSRSKRNPDLFFVELPSWSSGEATTIRGTVRELTSFNPELRPILACIFRCAWLDEAEDQLAILKKGDVDSPPAMRLHRLIQQAAKYADQWARWGRGEAWE